MKLISLIKVLGFRSLVPLIDGDKEIHAVFAGDRMSDLLCGATEDTLIVTHLTNSSVVKLIELMDVSAVCFLNGVCPEEPVLEAGRRHGACFLSSPKGMYETCGRIFLAMNSEPSDTLRE